MCIPCRPRILFSLEALGDQLLFYYDDDHSFIRCRPLSSLTRRASLDKAQQQHPQAVK